MVSVVPMISVVVYGAYSVYDAYGVYGAYGHNEIVSIGMKWSCVLVIQTPCERSTTT